MAATNQPTADELSKKPMAVTTTWAAHEADKARRAAEREKKAEKHEAARMSPVAAARAEVQKPHYYWTVEARYLVPVSQLPDADDGELKYETKMRDKVIAQNEIEAWAVFCDKAGVTRGRRNCKVKMTRSKELVSKETLHALAVNPPYRSGVGF